MWSWWNLKRLHSLETDQLLFLTLLWTEHLWLSVLILSYELSILSWGLSWSLRKGRKTDQRAINHLVRFYTVCHCVASLYDCSLLSFACLFVFFNFKKLEAFWLEMSPIFASSWAFITYLKLVKLRNESKILVFGYHCLCGISSKHNFHLQ